jgi:hypothetical protein
MQQGALDGVARALWGLSGARHGRGRGLALLRVCSNGVALWDGPEECQPIGKGGTALYAMHRMGQGNTTQKGHVLPTYIIAIQTTQPDLHASRERQRARWIR